MARKTVLVPALSFKDIRQKVKTLIKEKLPEYDEEPHPLDLIDIFEGSLDYLIGYEPDISTENNNIEGATDPIKKRIILPENTHDNLVKNNTRARYTLGHEIGHAHLHTPYFQTTHYDDKIKNQLLNRGTIPYFVDAEWQANAYSAELLMPFHHVENIIKKGGDTNDIMKTFWVGYQAASIRFDKITKYLKGGI